MNTTNTNQYLLKLADDSNRLKHIVEHGTGLMLTNISIKDDTKLPWSKVLEVSAVNPETNKKSTLYFDEFALFNMVTEGQKVPHCQGEVMDDDKAFRIQKSFIKDMIESNRSEYYFSLMKYMNTLANIYRDEERKHMDLQRQYEEMDNISDEKRNRHTKEEFTLSCNNAHYLEQQLYLMDYARGTYTEKLQNQGSGERQ